MSNVKNLANGLIDGTVNTSTTTINLKTGYGDGMPSVPFYLTLTPFGQLSTSGNSEIVEVTARTGDVLTVTRAQKGTIAKSFADGDIVMNGVYVEDTVLADSVDTDGTLSANSDTKIPSQKAVKAYADNNFVDLVSDQDIGGSKNFNGGIITATNTIDGSAILFSAYYGGLVALSTDGAGSNPNLVLMGWDSSINFGPGGDDEADTKIYRTDVNELSFDGAKLQSVADPVNAQDVATKNYVDTEKTDVLNTVYPVGCIYTETTGTNPGTTFGFGTWVATGEGRVLMGAGTSDATYTAGDTGGASTHSHPLSDNGQAKIGMTGGTPGIWGARSGNSFSSNVKANLTVSGDSGTRNYSTPLMGGTDNANGMPPYLVVYFWKRTA